MNRDGLRAWLDALMEEHARGNIDSELLKGAVEVAEEVSHQWRQVGQLRASVRYRRGDSEYRAECVSAGRMLLWLTKELEQKLGAEISVSDTLKDHLERVRFVAHGLMDEPSDGEAVA